MNEDTLPAHFPKHFDGAPVNSEGLVPNALPLEFTNGTCTYRIDAEQVHILNKLDDEHGGMQWSEPLSAYAGISHWVIAERTQEKLGFFTKLLSGKNEPAVNDGPRHAVSALTHKQEAWMSVMLYSCALADGEEGEAAEKIAQKYRQLFSFG
ncbi:MAG TPA: hypothetical protein QF359_12955 [Rhodospirillales bacterium]|nr:hypothetical protein [Rhodospirillales bacterium]